VTALDDAPPDLDSVLELARRRSREDPDAVQPRPNPGELDHEFGVSQNLPFSTPADDGSFEVMPDIDDGPTVRQLVAMRKTDGQARALYRLITLPIRSALKQSTFVPAEDGGEKEADFIDQMFNLPPNAGGMTTNFHRVMAQLLMALFDGFAAFEQVYQVPKTGPLKGKYVLKKLAHRPAETVTFLTDDTGGFAGLRQRATLNGKVVDATIPVRESLYYAAQEEERAFYGVSYFQSAYFHYDKKVKLYYIAHLAAQRAAVGTRKGKVPRNASASEKSKFNRALADLGVAQHISVPDGFDVDVLKEGGGFDFLSYINHHNSQMSKSILAAFFDSNQGGGASDTTLVNFGEQSDAMFLLMLKSVMDEIAAVINNYVIPKFIDWNFGTSKYPSFTWGSFTEEQRGAIKEIFNAIAPGQNTPEFYLALEEKVAEELGLELDYKEIQKRIDGDKAKTEAQMNGGQPPEGGSPAPGGNPPPSGPAGGGAEDDGLSKEEREGSFNDLYGVAASDRQAGEHLLSLADELLAGAREEVPLALADEILLSSAPGEFSAEELVELHGQKGEPGYALLHSPHPKVRTRANELYEAARGAGKSALEAQRAVGAPGAHVTADKKARAAGGSDVTEAEHKGQAGDSGTGSGTTAMQTESPDGPVTTTRRKVTSDHYTVHDEAGAKIGDVHRVPGGWQATHVSGDQHAVSKTFGEQQALLGQRSGRSAAPSAQVAVSHSPRGTAVGRALSPKIADELQIQTENEQADGNDPGYAVEAGNQLRVYHRDRTLRALRANHSIHEDNAVYAYDAESRADARAKRDGVGRQIAAVEKLPPQVGDLLDNYGTRFRAHYPTAGAIDLVAAGAGDRSWEKRDATMHWRATMPDGSPSSFTLSDGDVQKVEFLSPEPHELTDKEPYSIDLIDPVSDASRGLVSYDPQTDMVEIEDSSSGNRFTVPRTQLVAKGRAPEPSAPEPTQNDPFKDVRDAGADEHGEASTTWYNNMYDEELMKWEDKNKRQASSTPDYDEIHYAALTRMYRDEKRDKYPPTAADAKAIRELRDRKAKNRASAASHVSAPPPASEPEPDPEPDQRDVRTPEPPAVVVGRIPVGQSLSAAIAREPGDLPGIVKPQGWIAKQIEITDWDQATASFELLRDNYKAQGAGRNSSAAETARVKTSAPGWKSQYAVKGAPQAPSAAQPARSVPEAPKDKWPEPGQVGRRSDGKWLATTSGGQHGVFHDESGARSYLTMFQDLKKADTVAPAAKPEQLAKAQAVVEEEEQAHTEPAMSAQAGVGASPWRSVEAAEAEKSTYTVPLYHSAAAAAVPEILANGFKRSGDDATGGFGAAYGSGVYTNTLPHRNLAYAAKLAGRNVDAAQLELRLVTQKPVPQWKAGDHGKAVFTPSSLEDLNPNDPHLRRVRELAKAKNEALWARVEEIRVGYVAKNGEKPRFQRGVKDDVFNPGPVTKWEEGYDKALHAELGESSRSMYRRTERNFWDSAAELYDAVHLKTPVTDDSAGGPQTIIFDPANIRVVGHRSITPVGKRSTDMYAPPPKVTAGSWERKSAEPAPPAAMPKPEVRVDPPAEPLQRPQATVIARPPPAKQSSEQIKGFKPMQYLEVSPQDLPKYEDDPNWYFQQKVDGMRGSLVIEPGKMPWVKAKHGGKFASTTGAKTVDPMIEDLIRTGVGTPSEGPAYIVDGEILDGKFHVFDMVIPGQESMPWSERMALAESWVQTAQDAGVRAPIALPVARTADEKRSLHKATYDAGQEGLVLKRKDAPYTQSNDTGSKRTGDIVKAKYVSTADVVVMAKNQGIASGKTNAGEAKENALFGVWDEKTGKLIPAGGTSLRGMEKKFGPVEVGDVIEVAYLWASKDGMLNQPRMVGKRPDKRQEETSQRQFRFVDKSVLDKAVLGGSKAVTTDEITAEEQSTPAPEAVPAAKKASSGGSQALQDSAGRGGRGPLAGGYSVGQEALRYNDMQGRFQLVTVLGPVKANENGRRTEVDSTTHVGFKLPSAGSEVSDYGAKYGEAVDQMLPLMERGQAARSITPSLEGTRELDLKDLGLDPEVEKSVRKLVKSNKLRLDKPGETFSHDMLKLAAAKQVGMQAIGDGMGFTPEETDEAAEKLGDVMGSWRMSGDLDDDRIELHAAMEHLRSGGAPETPLQRGLIMQKAWSDATWNARYGRSDNEVTVGRFIQREYASRLAGMVGVRPDDWQVSQWPLSSWAEESAVKAVRNNFIGKDMYAAQLTTTVGQRETWVNFYGEAAFRTRGLKAPGEFIVDDSRPLSAERVAVEIHQPEQRPRIGSWDTTNDLTEAYEHLARTLGEDTDTIAAANHLSQSPNLQWLVGKTLPEPGTDLHNHADITTSMHAQHRPGDYDYQRVLRDPNDKHAARKVSSYEARLERARQAIKLTGEANLSATDAGYLRQLLSSVESDIYDEAFVQRGFVHPTFGAKTEEERRESRERQETFRVKQRDQHIDRLVRYSKVIGRPVTRAQLEERFLALGAEIDPPSSRWEKP
jgi:hypothetical protein